jgi:hypothetical protein
MSVEENLKAQAEIETAVANLYTIERAVELSLRNCVAGTVALSPTLKQLFYVAYLNNKTELEGILERHVSQSNKVGPMVSSKVLDIYGRCLQGLRSYTVKEDHKLYNFLASFTEYSQPLLQAQEVSDISLVSDEFIEEASGTLESEVSNETSEEFA